MCIDADIIVEPGRLNGTRHLSQQTVMFIVHRDTITADQLQLTSQLQSQQLKLSFSTSQRDPPHAGFAFASLSSTFLTSLPAEKSNGSTVKEPTTSTYYPEEVCIRSALGACSDLTGLGVRTKNLVVKNLNVYTIGLYVNHASAKPVLKKHKGTVQSAFVKSQQPYNEIISNDNVPKALRLVITYGGLKKASFLNALDDRLREPMKQAGDLASLQAFRSQFDDVDLKKGCVFTFNTGKAGKLITSMGSKQLGCITSPALVHALFNIYVGTDAVSPKTKESFGRGLHMLANA